MNSIPKRVAETLKLNLGVATTEPPMATICRGMVSPSGTVIAYADANGNLVNAAGAIIGSGLGKAPCAAATTANITIATALNNGDTLDGVTLATGDRVLVKDQTAPAENGIYIVGVTPARATDFDAWGEVPGAVVGVTAGTANAGLNFLAIAAQTGVIGTTAIAFNPYGGATGFTSPIITTDIRPVTNDGATLGTASLAFSDLFLATGATIVYGSNNVVLTHSSGILTMGTGELRITTPGTNAASVPTLGSTSTLTNKTLTNPVINSAAVARTATADGLTTGTIADAGFRQHITVTSADANHIIVLPTPTPGVEVVLDVGATGFELRSSAPTTVLINGGTGGAAVESAIPANSTVFMRCVSATAWKGFYMDADGDLAKVEAAA